VVFGPRERGGKGPGLGQGKGGRGGVDHGPNQERNEIERRREKKRGKFPSSLSHGHTPREKGRKRKKGQG
jgi:hypothetical protein